MFFIFVMITLLLLHFLNNKRGDSTAGLINIWGSPSSLTHTPPGWTGRSKGKAGPTAKFHTLECKGQEEEEGEKNEIQILQYMQGKDSVGRGQMWSWGTEQLLGWGSCRTPQDPILFLMMFPYLPGWEALLEDGAGRRGAGPQLAPSCGCNRQTCWARASAEWSWSHCVVHCPSGHPAPDDGEGSGSTAADGGGGGASNCA